LFVHDCGVKPHMVSVRATGPSDVHPLTLALSRTTRTRSASGVRDTQLARASTSRSTRNIAIIAPPRPTRVYGVARRRYDTDVPPDELQCSYADADKQKSDDVTPWPEFTRQVGPQPRDDEDEGKSAEKATDDDE
jgi:hypothetical protein